MWEGYSRFIDIEVFYVLEAVMEVKFAGDFTFTYAAPKDPPSVRDTVSITKM